MFSNKLKSLFEVSKTSVLKREAETLSGNLAKKYSETDDPFVTQFGQVSNFKIPRSFIDISASMEALWAKSPRLAIMFTLYLRIITRVVSMFDGSLISKAPHRGPGLKYESIMRMLWIYNKNPDSFWKNIRLFITLGSWKDVFLMLNYDLQYHGWDNKILDWTQVIKIILAGLENPNTINLVKKYLPSIKTNAKCTTLNSQADNMIAKYTCSSLFGKAMNGYTYKQYRKLKSSGTAHEWQKAISKGRFLELDFDTIHGKALSLLVSSKFLANHGLEEKYHKWISEKPVAKFTGLIHELFEKPMKMSYQKDTANKQFMGAVETAKIGLNPLNGLLVVRDTSGSMASKAHGTNLSSDMLACILGVFFDYLLPDNNHFKGHFVEFASKTRLKKWVGVTPVDKVTANTRGGFGSTNFSNVFKLFSDIKRNKDIPEDFFPSGILCISDGEFDPAQLGKTNVEQAFIILREAGFSEEYISKFSIILWNIPNTFYGLRSSSKFETYETNIPNIFYFSGYDPSIIAFLTGSTIQQQIPRTARDLLEAALNQPILNMVEV